ncbi:MAG TPA: DUF480 domain-containing protein [Gemmataceae bacterium]|nr:DUF480 domain-containing protein [Gemmataceae bacterium]
MPDPTPTQWPVLSMTERRLLGVLVEKQKTTPDVYPMSLNALVTGSNQKSNREPVLTLNGDEVEETLQGLQRQALATRVDSGRVEKWRHLLYEAWNVNKEEIAVLAELLLRGPQTEGELRGHVSRLEPVADLDALRALLRPMSERGLVVYLTPEGRRGTMLTHGFHSPEELERLRTRSAHESVSDEPPRPRAAVADPDRLAALAARVDELAAGQAELRESLAALQAQVRSLQESAGRTPP